MNTINPKWKPLLDILPPELQVAATPILQEWDKGVQEQFQARAEEIKKLEPFKVYVEQNIDPNYVLSAVQLADQVRDNPADVAKRMNETFNLGYLSKEEAEALQASSTNVDDPDDLGLEDMSTFKIEDHPQFKAMQKMVEDLKGNFETKTQAEIQAQEQADFDAYLDELEKNTEGPFNRILVSAYLYADENMSGEDAVKAYQTELAKQFTPEQLAMLEQNQQSTGQQQTDAEGNPISSSTAPPVVLDGSPSGSGLPSDAIDFGNLNKDGLNDVVEKLLEQAAQSSQ